MALLLSSAAAAAAMTTAASKSMLMRRLGCSDLVVSEYSLGGMTWGEQNMDQDAASQLSLAFDFGVNFIDTAEAYPVPIKSETSGKTDIASMQSVVRPTFTTPPLTDCECVSVRSR